MPSRRTFLKAAAAAAAVSAVPHQLRAALPTARLDRIGLELYTVRYGMETDVDATLARVAGIGYREVEFAGYFKREPAALRTTLDRLQLTAPSCHVDLDAVEAGLASTVSAAKTIGHRWVIVASVPERFFQSVASLKELARRFNAAGKRMRDAGLRYAYHNHDIELTPVQGAVPLDILLGETDPAVVDFEMDVFWVVKGGGDPFAYVDKYPGRFHLIHAKDATATPAHEMRDVGAGSIDWKRLFAERKKAGIEHVFVEHDEPKNAFASAEASYRYLKTLNF